MSYLFLAFKRAARSVYFPVMLAVFALTAYFAPAIGTEEGLPTAGVCDLDGSAISSRIAEYLTENGYELCADEAILRERIKSGEYGCGAVIPDGFGELVASGKPDGAITFIVTPTSYAPDLYKNHIAAAVYKECAPYITADALDGTVITFDDVYEKFTEMSAEGALFSFKEELTDADVSYETEREKTYTLAAISLFVFALMMYGASDALRCDIAPLSARIGIGKTIASAVLPDLAVRCVGVLTAYAAAAYARRHFVGDEMLTELIPEVAVYVCLCAAFGVLAVTVFADTAKTSACTFYLLVFSLLLCPIYFDVALVLPLVGKLRVLLPSYWIWMLDGTDGLFFALLAAFVSLAVSLLLMKLRFAHKNARELAHR